MTFVAFAHALQTGIRRFLASVITTVVLMAGTSLSAVGADECRCRGLDTGDPSHALASPLAQLRITCPVLAAILEESALQDLGEAFPADDARPRRIATVVAGDTASFARFVHDARKAGATMDDFRETLYSTAVTAGIPQAIDATGVLLRIFGEKSAPCANISGDAKPSS